MKNNVKHSAKKTQSTTTSITASKGVRNFRALLFQTYLVTGILMFIVLALFARIFPYFEFDLIISKFFQSIQFPGLLPLMQFISYWGYFPQMPILIIAILLVILGIGFRWESLMAGVNISGAGIITWIAKVLVGRSRPSHDLVTVVHELTDKSFPSGHVLTYVAFFGFLFFLSFTLIKNSILRNVLLIIFGSLVILVGPSRIYLGEHWPSDTLGAYLIGSVWLLFTIYLYRIGKQTFFKKQPTASS